MKITLKAIRGDSASLVIPLTYGGASYSAPGGTTFIFTAKQDANWADADASIQKTTGAGAVYASSNLTVSLVHADTRDLVAKAYAFDVQAQESGGTVKTVATGNLIISNDVTRQTDTAIPIFTTEPTAFQSATASAAAAAASAATANTQAGISTTQAGISTAQASAASGFASTATTQAGIATTKAGESAASAVATAADRVQTGLDRTAVGADKIDAASSASSASASATSANTAKLAAEAARDAIPTPSADSVLAGDGAGTSWLKLTFAQLWQKFLDNISLTFPWSRVSDTPAFGTAASRDVGQAAGNVLALSAPGQVAVGTSDDWGQITLASSSGGAIIRNDGGQLFVQNFNAGEVRFPNGPGTLALTSALAAYVPTTRTVNGQALSGNITITDGSGFSSLNASNLSSGTVSLARLVNTQTVGNANATITAGTRDVLLTSALTAPRTYTLPAASGYPAGSRITFCDTASTLTTTNTATLARAGADTINGGTSLILNTAGASPLLISDGTSRWNLDIRGVSRGGTGATTLTSGALLLGGGTGPFTTLTMGTGVATALALNAGAAGGFVRTTDTATTTTAGTVPTLGGTTLTGAALIDDTVWPNDYFISGSSTPGSATSIRGSGSSATQREMGVAITVNAASASSSARLRYPGTNGIFWNRSTTQFTALNWDRPIEVSAAIGGLGAGLPSGACAAYLIFGHDYNITLWGLPASTQKFIAVEWRADLTMWFHRSTGSATTSTQIVGNWNSPAHSWGRGAKVFVRLASGVANIWWDVDFPTGTPTLSTATGLPSGSASSAAPVFECQYDSAGGTGSGSSRFDFYGMRVRSK